MIGTRRAVGGDPPSTGVKQTFRDAWFVEGFTDFYARRLALRSGLHNKADFAAGWNQALLAYATSPSSAIAPAPIWRTRLRIPMSKSFPTIRAPCWRRSGMRG
ncbi:hypothetical protein ACRAWD_30785 [Caulobacter segnis]